MTHKFAKFLIFAIGVLGLSALPALATPACNQSGGLVLSDGTVCTLGGLTFDFESISFDPNNSADSLEIEGAPASYISGSDYVLDFQYLGVTPTDIDLVYSVTSTADNISQVDSSYQVPTCQLTSSCEPPASIVEDVCASDPLSASGCGIPLAGETNSSGAVTFSGTFGPEQEIWIEKDITNPGFSSFTDSVVATPEPSSLGLLFMAAFGIAAAARKYRRA